MQSYTVNDTKLTVDLTSDRYRATLTARNGVGRSDASALTIPACDFRGSHLGGTEARPRPSGHGRRHPSVSLGVHEGRASLSRGPKTFLPAPQCESAFSDCVPSQFFKCYFEVLGSLRLKYIVCSFQRKIVICIHKTQVVGKEEFTFLIH